MRLSLLFFLLFANISLAEETSQEEKYSTSQNCVSCHVQIVKEWKKSWHSKSHFSHDEYFQKTIEYMARKMRSKNEDTLQVGCSSCHNPKISMSTITSDDNIAAVMGLNTKIKEAVSNSKITEGINCVVCHNIDEIHENPDGSLGGAQLIKWLPRGVMSGPYSDAKSPYHKTEKRDFMAKDSNKLCFICHANKRSFKGKIIANTFKEYQKIPNPPLCIECHMGKVKRGIASNLEVDGKTKRRKIRSHGFEGGHSSKLLKGSLELNFKRKKDTLYIKLYNPNPHNVPTGYGSREVIVYVKYVGKQKYKEKTFSITSKFLDRRNRPTVAHYAAKVTENEYIPARGQKEFKLKIPKGAKKVNVKVFYRLVNEEVSAILQLEDKKWTKKMLIVKKTFKL